MKKINFLVAMVVTIISLFSCQRTHAQLTSFTASGTGALPSVHTGADTTYLKSTLLNVGPTTFVVSGVATGTNPTVSGSIAYFVSNDGVNYFAHPDTPSFNTVTYSTLAATVNPSSTPWLGTTVKSYNRSWYTSENKFKFIMIRIITTAIGGTSSPTYTWTANFFTRRSSGY